MLKSSQAVIGIETHEEQRAIDLIKRCSLKMHKPVLRWSVTQGLRDATTGQPTLSLQSKSYKAKPDAPPDPKSVLQEISKSRSPGIYILLDCHPYLDDPYVIRLVKEIAQDHALNRHHLIFISHEINMPAELDRFTAMFSISLPDQNTIMKLIIEEIKIWQSKKGNEKIKADKNAIDMLASNLTGLTVSETRRLIRNAIYDDDVICKSDLEKVQKAKYELLGNGGVLNFEYETASFNQVGGLKKLKQWLSVRKDVFLNADAGSMLEKPKGLLLVGVQGSGKSLAAKAVAGAWGVPLLRLDFGALYNKFFGETEKNIRRALELAELMSPCVLWLDEIEKGISTGDFDSGTSQRVLATFLTWMAENSKPVFIVATANDIQALPPELIRKGRMDEIFFVDLPAQAVRENIFKIHLNKRKVATQDIDLEALASKTEGFSGAEIEQAVVSALYNAHAQSKQLNQQMLECEVDRTNPLSVVMEASVTRLRQWAKERTVMAD